MYFYGLESSSQKIKQSPMVTDINDEWAVLISFNLQAQIRLIKKINFITLEHQIPPFS